MSLVTQPPRLASQTAALEGFATSSSLVTHLSSPGNASSTPGSPPANHARVGRFPAHENGPGFPVAPTSAAGSPSCSPDDTPPPRNNAAAYDAADQGRRTGCNGSICAARQDACLAPSPALAPATIRSSPAPIRFTREEHPSSRRRTFLGEVLEENPPKKTVTFKPAEEDEFHPAADIRHGANLWLVKEALGHESIETLSPYVKLTIPDLKKTLARCHPRERDGR